MHFDDTLKCYQFALLIRSTFRTCKLKSYPHNSVLNVGDLGNANLINLTERRMRTILIGITGASSSGKSTLAHLLKSILPHSEIIHEDDFYKPEEDIPYDPIRKDRDWDCPDAIDMDAMKQTLSVLTKPNTYSMNLKAAVRETDNGYFDYAMASTEPTVNDAFFNNDERIIKDLMEKVNVKLDHFDSRESFRIFLIDGFLILPDKELLKMFSLTLFFKTSYEALKNRREKRTYNVGGDVWADPPGYFDTFVWPGYYTYHKNLFIRGNDEPYIKETGGNLKNEFMEQYNVFEFDNNDQCDADKLIKKVTLIIADKIFQGSPHRD